MNSSSIIQISDLGFPWKTLDPFLFCVYHNDAYPRGNVDMGPDASLTGRTLGNDFSYDGGWSMYHGSQVPGFPAHPHRGFETITIARHGFVDHADSLGALARYGAGDVQWLTTGRGIVHSEMFPLLNAQDPNPLEVFQIWLNLPGRSKMAEPRITMYWSEDVAHFHFTDSEARRSTVSCFAGTPESFSKKPIHAPPDSWAAQPGADVAVWTIKMAPHASLTLPRATGSRTRRTLYDFKGDGVAIAGTPIRRRSAIEVHPNADLDLRNGSQETEMLLLQGCPIGEPIVQHGPFVMNTQAEIAATMEDYRRTRFGGWPWRSDAPVQPRTAQRFLRHPDGRTERPATAQREQRAGGD